MILATGRGWPGEFHGCGLGMDAVEGNDLAEAKPELVARAGIIFTGSHRPDPHWPLDRLTDALVESRKEAWKTKRWRDENKWAPENARQPPN